VDDHRGARAAGAAPGGVEPFAWAALERAAIGAASIGPST
jgi:hypothetical protein